MSRKEKKAREQKLSTRQLINTKAVGDYSLKTYDGDDLVYFMIRPTNLSVLSDSSVGARVYALMNVLKGVAEIEMLCLNSRENFEENKSFLRKRDAYQEGKHLIPELTIASYERAFEIEYTHHSTAIEGNTLTLIVI